MAKLIIPTPLRKFTNDQSAFDTESKSVLEALNSLTARFPELKNHLFDDRGSLRKFIRIYVGDQDIRELSNEKTTLEPTTVVSIIPAIAGGLKSNVL